MICRQLLTPGEVWTEKVRQKCNASLNHYCIVSNGMSHHQGCSSLVTWQLFWP